MRIERRPPSACPLCRNLTKTIYTHCRICLATCGLEVDVDEDANPVLSIRPYRRNPYRWYDFCRKGRTAGEVVQHPRRILTPMRRVGDRYVRASYEASEDIAGRLNAIIDHYGPDAVGYLVQPTKSSACRWQPGA